MQNTQTYTHTQYTCKWSEGEKEEDKKKKIFRGLLLF